MLLQVSSNLFLPKFPRLPNASGYEVESRCGRCGRRSCQGRGWVGTCGVGVLGFSVSLARILLDFFGFSYFFPNMICWFIYLHLHYIFICSCYIYILSVLLVFCLFIHLPLKLFWRGKSLFSDLSFVFLQTFWPPHAWKDDKHISPKIKTDSMVSQKYHQNIMGT